ncbi:hypothetical protein AM274_06360, partial [Pseudomonas nunensis]
EAAFGGAAVVSSDDAVYQEYLAVRFYDGFAAERSLALLGSCYGDCSGRRAGRMNPLRLKKPNRSDVTEAEPI